MMKRTLEEYRGIAEGYKMLGMGAGLTDACADIATLSAALESKDKIIAELVEALERDKLDAERYRWIRTHFEELCDLPVFNDDEDQTPTAVDEEVDAALSKAKQGAA